MKLIDADAFDAVLVDAQKRAKNNFQYGFLSSVRANLADVPEAEAYTEAKKRIENMEKIIEDQQERIDIMAADMDWIPVSEAKPKSMCNKVLVWLEHDDLVGYIGYGHYEKYQGEEMWYDLEHNEQFAKRGYRVTHWKPEQKPPKEGDQP